MNHHESGTGQCGAMYLESDQQRNTQKLTPPLRFGYINPGLSRGSYPSLRNLRFLSRLQLKTVVSLVPETPTDDLVQFADMAGIKLFHFTLTRMAPISENTTTILLAALQICIDPRHHPVYVHCLDGRRVTSLLVLLLRRLQGWTPLSTLSEYWRYQVSCRSPILRTEIEKATKELESWAASNFGEVVLPDSIPKWLWGGDKHTTVQGIKISTHKQQFQPHKDSAL